jgi:hypothetical protein
MQRGAGGEDRIFSYRAGWRPPHPAARRRTSSERPRRAVPALRLRGSRDSAAARAWSAPSRAKRHSLAGKPRCRWQAEAAASLSAAPQRAPPAAGGGCDPRAAAEPRSSGSGGSAATETRPACRTPPQPSRASASAECAEAARLHLDQLAVRADHVDDEPSHRHLEAIAGLRQQLLHRGMERALTHHPDRWDGLVCLPGLPQLQRGDLVRGHHRVPRVPVGRDGDPERAAALDHLGLGDDAGVVDPGDVALGLLGEPHGAVG